MHSTHFHTGMFSIPCLFRAYGGKPHLRHYHAFHTLLGQVPIGTATQRPPHAPCMLALQLPYLSFINTLSSTLAA